MPHSAAPQPLPLLRQTLARLHLQLILFSVILAALSLLVSGLIVIRSHAGRNLELLARTVAYTAEPAVVFGDRPAIAEAIASVGAMRGIDWVEVRDPAGRRLARWSHVHAGLRGQLVDAANGLVWPDPVVAPIRRNQALIGEVVIAGNCEGILRYLLSGLIIALSCLGLTVIAMRILSRRLQQDVIVPLDHVAQIAHAVRAGRAFDQRVPSFGIAEIDRFGDDFNALLAELQGWNAGAGNDAAGNAGADLAGRPGARSVND